MASKARGAGCDRQGGESCGPGRSEAAVSLLDSDTSVATGVELMVQVNDLGQSNGEQAFWIDGRLVRDNGQIISHLGPGYPNGSWLRDKWSPDPAGEPFEGFRWRTAADLLVNYVWLYVYTEEDSYDIPVWYDDVVGATSYIGPLYTGSAGSGGGGGESGSSGSGGSSGTGAGSGGDSGGGGAQSGGSGGSAGSSGSAGDSARNSGSSGSSGGSGSDDAGGTSGSDTATSGGSSATSAGSDGDSDGGGLEGGGSSATGSSSGSDDTGPSSAVGANAGSGDGSPSESSDGDDGCSCSAIGTRGVQSLLAQLLVAALLLVTRRRRR
jgi:hypothetical protein